MSDSNHSQILLETFQQLCRNEQLTDVQLKCSGTILKVHRAVLVSFSQLFHSLILDSSTDTSPEVIDLEEYGVCDIESLQTVVDFMYTGVAAYSLDAEIEKLRSCARILKVTSLTTVLKDEHVSPSLVKTTRQVKKARPKTNQNETVPVKTENISRESCSDEMTVEDQTEERRNDSASDVKIAHNGDAGDPEQNTSSITIKLEHTSEVESGNEAITPEDTNCVVSATPGPDECREATDQTSRQHSDLFECEQCGKQYQHKQSVNRHRKSCGVQKEQALTQTASNVSKTYLTTGKRGYEHKGEDKTENSSSCNRQGSTKAPAAKRWKARKVKSVQSDVGEAVHAECGTAVKPEDVVDTEIAAETQQEDAISAECGTVHGGNENMGASNDTPLTDIEDLRIPIERFRKGELYHCTVCNYKTNYSSHFKSHRIRHGSQKMFLCDKCGAGYKYMQSVVRHRKNCAAQNLPKSGNASVGEMKSDPEAQYKCSFCSFSTVDAKELGDHVESNHSEERIYNCPADKCTLHGDNENLSASDDQSDAVTDMEDLSIPSGRFRKGGLYHCTVCGYKTRHHTQFKNHRISHGSQMFHCDKCGARYKFIQSMMIHRKNCDGQNQPKVDKTSVNKMKSNPEAQYKCSFCSFSTLDAKELGDHFCSNHSEQRTYKCPACEVTFKLKSQLVSHVKEKMCKHHEEVDMRNVESDEATTPMVQPEITTEAKSSSSHHRRVNEATTRLLDELKLDMSQICTEENGFQCTKCSYRTQAWSCMRNHLHTHLATRKSFMCSVCGRSFTSQYSLKLHENSHSGVYRYSCSECNKGFIYLRQLERHTLVKHRRVKPYVCTLPGCSYAVADPKALEKHLEVHRTGRQYLCDLCGRGFIRANALRYHRKTDHAEAGDTRPLHKCPRCDFKTKQKASLQNHIRVKHENCTGRKVHKSEANLRRCDLCEYKCYDQSRLRLHMMRHRGDLPYKCDKCDYASNLKSSLVKHGRSHDKLMSFVCKVCGKRYNSESGYRQHMRHHNNQDTRPYACNQCDKRYFTKSALIQHKFTHVNLKPFGCKLCSFDCYKRGVLASHMMAVHNIKAVHIKPRTELLDDPTLEQRVYIYRKTGQVDSGSASGEHKPTLQKTSNLKSTNSHLQNNVSSSDDDDDGSQVVNTSFSTQESHLAMQSLHSGSPQSVLNSQPDLYTTVEEVVESTPSYTSPDKVHIIQLSTDVSDTMAAMTHGDHNVAAAGEEPVLYVHPALRQREAEVVQLVVDTSGRFVSMSTDPAP